MSHSVAGIVMCNWLACMLSLSMLLPVIPPEQALAQPPVSAMRRSEAQQILQVPGKPILYRRLYALDNGDSVSMGRLATTKAGDAATVVEQLSVSGKTATIRYYDEAEKVWVNTALKGGHYTAGMLQLSFPQEDYFFYLPKTYRRLAADGLKYQPQYDGYLQAKQTDQGWNISIFAKASKAGLNADYVFVQSEQLLLDWGYPNTGDLWKNYTMSGNDGKWCYDGYYWPAPFTYAPSGENVYYRCAASYLMKSFAYAGSVHRVAADLARCTLDSWTFRQSPDGCWLTPARSTWLTGDYGIGAGFYDTRFNTDLVQIMVYAYIHYGGESLRESMNRYADFYLKFAAAHHTKTSGGGWLVDDYWSPYGNRMTHTSLNHQIAECDLLYRLVVVLKRPELAETADKLLRGIHDTGTHWIRPDRNLHYAVYPGGRYGGSDYPYLTYDDLFKLRSLLKEQGRPDEPILSQLIASKKAWMDQNKVTGYLT